MGNEAEGRVKDDIYLLRQEILEGSQVCESVGLLLHLLF